MDTTNLREAIDSPVVLQELLAGDGIGLGEAARIATVSSETAWRWVTLGVRRDGVTYRLEAARVGCRWKTTRAALARFLARSTGAMLPAVEAAAGPTAQGRTPKRAREVAEAQAELARLGMG